VIFFNADGAVGVKSEEKGTVYWTNPYEDHQSQYGSDVSATYVSLCLYYNTGKNVCFWQHSSDIKIHLLIFS
jgi:hypothetical protein